MKNNVCKFPPTSAQNDLSVSCFVLETNRETMIKGSKLLSHRMILVESGEGEFLVSNTSYSFGVGTLLFGFRGESFSLLRGDGVSYLYIDFDGIRAQSLFSRFGITQDNRKKENFNNLIPFFKDSLLSTEQENVDITAEGLLLYVFSRLYACAAAQNEVLKRIIELTDDNFQDPELSISTVAQKMGYNSKYLSHFFKKSMNISYSEYLRNKRFKYAISLFEVGISSVKNVALLSGFSDPLYFSGVFKKATGLSPKEFIAKRSDGNG